jgi:LytTr DNA-binding domain
MLANRQNNNEFIHFMLFKFLKQPYPLVSNIKSNLIHNACIGVFIAFFLIVFQPFDSDRWEDPYKLWKLGGYGVVAFLMPTLFLLISYSLNKKDVMEEDWVVWKEIVRNFIIIFLVVLGNMVYANLFGMGDFSLESFLGFCTVVSLLGVFPIVAGILIRHNRYLEMNQKEAQILGENIMHQQDESKKEQASNQEIKLTSENEKDAISLIVNDLLYIESADNYSTIVFVKQEKIQKELLRGSLKRFEQQLEQFPQIQRCHRSYILNLNLVLNISGNAQGYRVTLPNLNDTIPVSRNYGAEILTKLKMI